MGREDEVGRLRERESDEAYFSRVVGATSASRPSSEEFAAVVKPLEDRSCSLLRGRGRQTCERGFREAPDGFRELVAEVGRGVFRNPLGRLIRLVESGDHRLLQRQANEAEGNAAA